MLVTDRLPDTVAWRGELEGHLELLDQTLLPHTVEVLQLRDVAAVIDAIRRLCVRGAPAIGVAAGYGLVLGVRERRPLPNALRDCAREVAALLLAARPTAVNLQWALDRCLAALGEEPTLARLFAEACAIHADEEAMSRSIGEHGKALIRPGATVLTHCNAGRLATAGDGTALAPMFAAWRDGVRFRVFADETRPLLQGARLTALELHREGIPVQLLADGAGAGLIARGEVSLVIVGADRIARNGDFANKVGTYPLALACAAHRVPFYCAAPVSTFDMSLANGRLIPIEERDATELTTLAGRRIAPAGVGARNPAFDVTPHGLVTGFVTDVGVLQPPFDAAVKRSRVPGR
ncbi:MAG: S-methyl-5-thioribose-1-phosphate isomerase [Planctomycetes bacterium]|nr:S-methyl-5-thioribose-1-phosphate isomerase [Planctomycetota bacterium]